MRVKQETLKPVEGVAEQIGFYLAGLEEVRGQLREVVEDLTEEEVSAKLSPTNHSIGQLILHCAEAEWWWIHTVVAEKPLDEEQAKREAHWDILLDEDFASKQYSSEFCIAEVDRITAMSKEVLQVFQDHDLGRYFGWDKDDETRIEKSLRWILHHLIDHEAQHKGQILMLKRLLRERA